MSEHPTQPCAIPVGNVPVDAGMGQSEAVSAWVDGELPALASQALCAASDDGADASWEAWHRYHLIGDVLRATAETAFVCSEGALSVDQSRRSAQHIMAQAHTVHMAPLASVTTLPAAQREAANDSVFRWKMASGFASVVALGSLVWALGASPTGGVTGPVLAQSAPAANTSVAATGLVPGNEGQQLAGASAVVVSTPHGQVLRDARLDALLLAHRQAGGATALQVPAGFLRNATFDANQR